MAGNPPVSRANETAEQAKCRESIERYVGSLRSLIPKGREEREIFVSGIKEIVEKLDIIATEAFDGPMKARVCADLLFEMRAQPTYALLLIGRAGGKMQNGTGKEWEDAMARSKKCNPSIDPINLFFVSLRLLKTRKMETKGIDTGVFHARLDAFKKSIADGSFLEGVPAINGERQEPKLRGGLPATVEDELLRTRPQEPGPNAHSPK